MLLENIEEHLKIIKNNSKIKCEIESDVTNVTSRFANFYPSMVKQNFTD